jgi:hypothetical protein
MSSRALPCGFDFTSYRAALGHQFDDRCCLRLTVVILHLVPGLDLNASHRQAKDMCCISLSPVSLLVACFMIRGLISEQLSVAIEAAVCTSTSA